MDMDNGYGQKKLILTKVDMLVLQMYQNSFCKTKNKIAITASTKTIDNPYDLIICQFFVVFCQKECDILYI